MESLTSKDARQEFLSKMCKVKESAVLTASFLRDSLVRKKTREYSEVGFDENVKAILLDALRDGKLGSGKDIKADLE